MELLFWLKVCALSDFQDINTRKPFIGVVSFAEGEQHGQFAYITAVSRDLTFLG